MKEAIEISFFEQSMNLLGVLEVCYPFGPKESLDYSKSTRSVSMMVIFPLKVVTTFSNMAMA